MQGSIRVIDEGGSAAVGHRDGLHAAVGIVADMSRPVVVIRDRAQPVVGVLKRDGVSVRVHPGRQQRVVGDVLDCRGIARLRRGVRIVPLLDIPEVGADGIGAIGGGVVAVLPWQVRGVGAREIQPPDALHAVGQPAFIEHAAVSLDDPVGALAAGHQAVNVLRAVAMHESKADDDAVAAPHRHQGALVGQIARFAGAKIGLAVIRRIENRLPLGVIIGQHPVGLDSHAARRDAEDARIPTVVRAALPHGDVEMDVRIPVVVPAGSGQRATIFGPGVPLLVIDRESDFLPQRGLVENRGVAQPQVEVRLGDAPDGHGVSRAVGAARLAWVVVPAMVDTAGRQHRAVVIERVFVVDLGIDICTVPNNTEGGAVVVLDYNYTVLRVALKIVIYPPRESLGVPRLVQGILGVRKEVVGAARVVEVVSHVDRSEIMVGGLIIS